MPDAFSWVHRDSITWMLYIRLHSGPSTVMIDARARARARTWIYPLRKAKGIESPVPPVCYLSGIQISTIFGVRLLVLYVYCRLPRNQGTSKCLGIMLVPRSKEALWKGSNPNPVLCCGHNN